MARLHLRFLCATSAIVLLSTFGLPTGQAQADEKRQPLTLQGPLQQQEQATVVMPQVEPPPPQALSSAKKRRPAVVLLHPGFGGDDATSRALADAFTGHGILTVLPSYRGESRGLDGARSDGRIEFCSGEVDDAQAVIEWLRRRDDVDPFRIGLLGMSHGGCIALRTAIREPRIRAIATISAPVAIEPLLRHLQDHPYRFFLYNGILAEQLTRYIDGGLHDPSGSYAVRSPLFLAAKLAMPMIILHGAGDHIVPAEQACWLAQVLSQSGRQIEERWLKGDGNPLDHPTTICGLAGPRQAQVTGPAAAGNPRTELWLVEGQDHIFFSKAARAAAQAKAVDFLLRELFD